MRGATECAQRLKTLFSALRSRLGKASPLPGGDPLTQAILGVLSRDVPEPKAHEALDRIRGVVVDYNELRVVPPIELAEMVGDYPDVRLKCEDISRVLNKVFALNHSVTLDHLAELPKKEMRAQLDELDGLEPYSRARVRLLGLNQAAIPLDEAMWAYARREQIVDQRCPLDEAQAFLERQIADEDAMEFVSLLKRQAWNDMGAAVRRGEAERILSVPPDRTSRNMLQAVGGSPEPEPRPAEPEAPPPATEKKPSKAKKVAAPRAKAAKKAPKAKKVAPTEKKPAKKKTTKAAKPARKAKPKPAATKRTKPAKTAKKAVKRKAAKPASRRSAKSKPAARATTAKASRKRKAVAKSA